MRAFALTVAALVAVACSRTVKVETDAGRTDIDFQRPNEPETWSGTLSAMPGFAITGTASGTTAHDVSHIKVSISGAAPGSTHPWHVHEGKCSDASPPIAGSASAYPPLVVGSDGRATAEAHLSIELNEARNYIINIHASPTSLGTIVACGDYND